MNALTRRLERLEASDSDQVKQLPDVVPDTTTDAELASLRRHGRNVMRYSEFLELCL